jgi:hypothetical protein
MILWRYTANRLHLLRSIAMSTPPARTHKRFQFNLRFALVFITAACLMLGFMAWLLPNDLPITGKIVSYGMILLVLVFAAWTFLRGQQNPWTTPADYVTVKVDAKWLRRVQSPFVMGPIAALTGVSITFAPLALLWCGQAEQFGLVEWIVAPICFLTIYLVPGFYMRLAHEVMAELLKSRTEQGQEASADISRQRAD